MIRSSPGYAPLVSQSADSIARHRLASTPWARLRGARLVYGLAVAVGQGLARAGVSANSLTLGGLVLAIGAGVCVAQGQFTVALVLLLVSGLLDLLDGVVARAAGTVGPAGALLDSVCDRVADAAPLIGLALVLPQRQAIAPLSALVLGFVISYVRARTEALGAALPGLWMRRAERLVALAACLLLMILTGSPGLLWASLLLLAGAYGLATIHTLVIAYRALRSPGSAR